MNRRLLLRALFHLAFVPAVVLVPIKVAAQLAGIYRSTPDGLVTYVYQGDHLEFTTLPADITVRFADIASPTLTATIHRPIIGDRADDVDLPIVDDFPMVVSGTSNDGLRYSGNLLDSQYVFDWLFQQTAGGELVWNGLVTWTGGRLEETTIQGVRLLPLSPGDYNGNGAVAAADFVVWRNSLGEIGSGLAADGNGNDRVGFGDIAVWQENFGETSPTAAAATALPEPASWILLCGWMSAVILGRRACDCVVPPPRRRSPVPLWSKRTRS